MGVINREQVCLQHGIPPPPIMLAEEERAQRKDTEPFQLVAAAKEESITIWIETQRLLFKSKERTQAHFHLSAMEKRSPISYYSFEMFSRRASLWIFRNGLYKYDTVQTHQSLSISPWL